MQKILLVDDDADTRMILQEVLEYSEFQVLTAIDGEESITKVQNENPDIVLMDIAMPKINGLEAIEKIRQFSKVPVLIITAFQKVQYVDQLKKLNIQGYFQKPLNPVELIDRITSLLQK